MSEINQKIQLETETHSSNIFVLEGPLNGKVYLIGTAHFSLESQKEVKELIQKVKPNRVVLELCQARSGILNLDEETIIRDAKDMNFSKLRKLIKETSIAHGLLQYLMVNLYAKVTEELGIGPGGEFRVANNEAKKLDGCTVILGDMPIKLTLNRSFNSLPWYRKIRLAWCLLTTDTNLTKEDIEELKKHDMLETLVKEFGDTFPEFKRVLIDERDMYLTHSLKQACQPIPNDSIADGFSPACIVGVVGLGHCKGIKENWPKNTDISYLIQEKQNIVNNSLKKYGNFIKFSMLIGVVSVFGYQLFRLK